MEARPLSCARRLSLSARGAVKGRIIADNKTREEEERRSLRTGAVRCCCPQETTPRSAAAGHLCRKKKSVCLCAVRRFVFIAGRPPVFIQARTMLFPRLLKG